MTITAVVFDMDGVLLNSGPAWNEVLHELFRACKRSWDSFDQKAFAGGDNSKQWASYLRRTYDLPLAENEIIRRVTAGLLDWFRTEPPLLPGAAETLARIGEHFKLGLASSSPREVIAHVLATSALGAHFAAWVSSDDVPEGKPAPYVYLRICRLLDVPPESAVAVEDSPMGVKAAKAAGLRVIAIPRLWFPLDEQAITLADLVIASLDELTIDTVAAL